MNVFRPSKEIVAYERGISSYVGLLQSFIIANSLPIDWFDSTDHVGIRCRNSRGFDWSIRNVWKDLSHDVTCLRESDRRVATARLSGRLLVGSFDSVEYVEVKEPLPSEIGTGIAGVQHMGFYYPHFPDITDVLDRKCIDYSLGIEGEQRYLSVGLDKHGQEAEFTNNPMWLVVRAQFDNPEIQVL